LWLSRNAGEHPSRHRQHAGAVGGNIVGVRAVVPLSPLLIFGLGPIQAWASLEGGVAVVSPALTAAGMAWYIWSAARSASQAVAPAQGLFRHICAWARSGR
jgi:hypothetical protein